MKKMVSFAVAALCVLLFMYCAYAEAFVFPGDLTRIEAEAFANCGYIRGLVKLPATVVYVGPRAFDGTDVFALEIGDGAAEISADAFDELGYIYLHGRESRLPAELIGKAKYLFVDASDQMPENSAAEMVGSWELESHDGFYYRLMYGENGDSDAILLCAVDGTLLPETVTIPGWIGNVRVTQISENAFWGCDGVKKVLLPDTAVLADGAAEHLPAGAIQTYAPSPMGTPQFSMLYSNATMVEARWSHAWPEETKPTGYYVWRCSERDGEYEKVATLTCGEGYHSHTWTDEGLPLGSTWYYALQAFADDGAVYSELSAPQEVKIGNTILKMATVSVTHNGDSCTVEWASPEGAEVLRTDVYRSWTYDGEYTLIASVEGSQNTYTDADAVVFGQSAYYRVQQKAVINGTEWESQLSLAKGVWLYEPEWETSFAVYEDGLHIRFDTFYDAVCVKFYLAETESGPWKQLEGFTATPDEEYWRVETVIPSALLEKGGYLRACVFDANDSALSATSSIYVPAKGSYGVTLKAEKEAYYVGEYMKWDAAFSQILHQEQVFVDPDGDGTYESAVVNYNRNVIDFRLYLNDADLGRLSYSDNVLSYMAQKEGIYKLVAYLRRHDGGTSSTVLGSATVQVTNLGSPHPYGYDDAGEYWYAGEEGSGYQTVTFAENTYFDSSDQAVIYDQWGNDLYTYTGNELAKQTITVRGSGVGVRIECGGRRYDGRGFGFAIMDMVSAPYQPIKIADASVNHESIQVDESLTWTMAIADACPPYKVTWNVYKDDALIDSIIQDGMDTTFSLTYYPMAAGRYTAVATISDFVNTIDVPCGSCDVTMKYSASSNFTYSVSSSGVTITGYTGNETTVIVPATIESQPVTRIASDAFSGSTVQAWMLPDSIEYIGARAFFSAAAAEIRLPENGELQLGQQCFSGAKNLHRMTLPGGLSTIPDRCFHDSGLQSIYIPSNVKKIDALAFSNCASLSTVTFAADSVRDIAEKTFLNCQSLTKVILPKSLQSVELDAFDCSSRKSTMTVWMGSEVSHIHYMTSQYDPGGCDLVFGWIETWDPGDWPFGNSIVYAPRDSYAAKTTQWASNTSFNYQVRYGGPGCDELFGCEHDYEVISDKVQMDAETGMHVHDVVYQCYRCGVKKEETQAKAALGCWRCEAKEACGANASIPEDKFEILSRYQLKGELYYRIRLVEEYKGVRKDAETLFMDDCLKMVTDEETLKTLFRVYMYTGEGELPWEYTASSGEHPYLEKRKEDVNAASAAAQRQLELAESFIKMDACYELIGEAGYNFIQKMWGDPKKAIEIVQDAMKSVQDASEPDMDTLLVVTQVYILQHMADTMDKAAQTYENSLKGITDKQGIVICEKAEASLTAYADVMGMYRLCVDNGAPIIDEIADCGSAFGVGVRNIITMLKGAASDSFAGKLWTFVAGTLYRAFTDDDFDGSADAMYGVKIIGDMCDLLNAAVGDDVLSPWVDLYKAGQFSLDEVLHMKSAFEAYETHYNAFCLTGTQLQETHRTLAGE